MSIDFSDYDSPEADIELTREEEIAVLLSQAMSDTSGESAVFLLSVRTDNRIGEEHHEEGGAKAACCRHKEGEGENYDGGGLGLQASAQPNGDPALPRRCPSHGVHGYRLLDTRARVGKLTYEAVLEETEMDVEEDSAKHQRSAQYQDPKKTAGKKAKKAKHTKT